MGIHIPLARIIPVQIYIFLDSLLLNISVMFWFPQVTCRGAGDIFSFLNVQFGFWQVFFHVTLNHLGLAVARDEMLCCMHP